MSDLVRTDTIFGKRANIVGNISADLVLESLGKIYIKSRNSSKTLEEVIQSIAGADPDDIGSRTVILEGIETLDLKSIKEGQFVFDKLSNILYLIIDGEPLELINVAPEGTGYVKRSGDTMTGRLTINVPSGPPLYVNSSELVENLNANYLQGYSGEQFAKKPRDEKITGKWTFRAPTYFQSNVKMQQDIVVEGSVGSSNFASGFSGYGWRMDADTNTLTIDNLVVRKLMKVYELVVNRISATNGSLWVTNAGKVVEAQRLPIYTHKVLQAGRVQFQSEVHDFVEQLQKGFYFVIFPDKENSTITTLSGNEILNASGSNRNTFKSVYNSSARRDAYVVRVNNLNDILNYINESDNPSYYELVTTFSPNPQEETDGYRAFKLYDEEFKFDTVFPMIPRDYYHVFQISEDYRKQFEDALKDFPEREGMLLNEYLSKAQQEADFWPGPPGGFIYPQDVIAYVKPYYKYYTSEEDENFYMVKFDDDQLPVFKPGDILRCQKWTYGGIKYYDAVVCNYIENSTYIIQLSDSILDYTTKISYDDNLNPTYTQEKDEQNTTLYDSSIRKPQSIIGLVEKGDGLVQMGNLWDTQRQNAVYITSTDDNAPFIDVMSGLNRPDYSVIYYTPSYRTIKLYQRGPYEGIGCLNSRVPYTGEYYIQNSNVKAQYAIGKYTYNYNTYDLFVDLAEYTGVVNRLSEVQYLSESPNDDTQFSGEASYGEILTEVSGTIIDENDYDAEYTFVREDVEHNLKADSTKTTRVRIGKLDGIKDELFPTDKQPYGYGLYASNAFLVGEFYLSNGRSLAEISDEAITFAQAVRDSAQNSIDILRNDTAAIDKRLSVSVARLKNNVYTKNQLLSAGMRIKENVLGLWGGSVQIFTTYDELYGWTQPTALFENGKIRGKFLEVDEAHSCKSATVPTSIFTANGLIYTSNDPYATTEAKNGTVRVFRPKTKRFVDSNGKIYYTEGDNVYYVRRFSTNSGMIWVIVNPDGYPPKNSLGAYIIQYPSFTWYKSDGTSETYSGGVIPETAEYYFVNEYTEPLRVWGLEYNGMGNLGGSTLYWTPTGKVVVNGILYSKEGNIGGLNLSSDSLFTISEGNGSSYNPLVISTQDYGYSNGELTSLPYVQLQQVDMQGTLRSRTVMTSGGLYYLAATQSTNTNTSWYNFETMQVPGTIFSLTLIPIISTEANFPTLYARYITNFKCFYYIDLTYDEGNFALNFHSLEGQPQNNDGVDWFIKQLYLGNIQFQVSGISCGLCNYNYNETANFIHTSGNPDTNGYTVNSRNGSSYMQWYMFNSCSMQDNPSIRFQFHEDESGPINATIKGMAFTGSKYSYGNGVDSNWLSNCNFSRRFTWGARVSAQFDWMIAKNYNDGGLYWIGSSSRLFNDNQFNNHVIWIQTADDNSPNWGGFTLTATYTPTFDARFISNVETLQPADYTDEDWNRAVQPPTNP